MEQHVISPAAEEREQEETLLPGANPVKDIQGGRVSDQAAFHLVVDFLQRASTLSNCPSLHTGKHYKVTKKCTCLHQLRPRIGPLEDGVPPDLLCQMVAAHVCYFGSLKEQERRRTEIEWIRSEALYNTDTGKANDPCRYFLCIQSTKHIPGENQSLLLPSKEYHNYMAAEDNMRSPRVCVNALRLVYGLGDTRWKSSVKNAKANTFPVHGLVGRKGSNSNKRNPDAQAAENAVVEFLAAVGEESAEVPATRMIRCLTGEMRKEEEGLLELPRHFSKRSLYVRFCFERGWKITHDAKMRQVQNQRTDDGWNDDDDPTPIVSWPRFLDIWSERFPKLSIRAKSEDICGECLVVSMRFKYKSFRRFIKDVQVPEDTDAPELVDLFRQYKCEFGNLSTDAEMEETEDAEGQGGGDDRDGDDDAPALQEADMKLLEASLLNVKAYTKQRELHNAMVQKAMKAIVEWQVATAVSWLYPAPSCPPSKKLRYLLTLAFTADYCMNLNLPYLGAEQVGDAYYYSPLNANCFGIADQTRVRDFLDAFVYMDHQTGKGGNQVASLIFKMLLEKGLLDKDNPIGEVIFTFDNCAGQNKNMIVLGLFAWLVEIGYFHRCTIIFLVRGHTKNTCDRLFNTLKVNYRKQNVYSTKQLLEALNRSVDINACWVRTEEFIDWSKATTNLYKTPAGKVKCSQNFKYNKDKPGILTISKFDGEPEEVFQCHKRVRAPLSREELLEKQFPPAPLDEPKMADIRHIEMYSKWRPFIPLEHRTDWWFTKAPTPDQIIKVRTDRASAQAKRKLDKISNNKPVATPKAARKPPPTASL